MEPLQHNEAVALTTEIVVGYVSNNSVTAEALPGLIRSVYHAIVDIGRPGAREGAGRTAETGGIDQSFDHAGLPHLPRRWTAVQVAAAAPRQARHDAIGLSGQVGTARNVSDGGGELLRQTHGAGEVHRAWAEGGVVPFGGRNRGGVTE